MLTFQREIPLRHDVDVLVIGGGPAGCAAAVSAARQGANVFLAEALGCFGGAGTAALVPYFMPFGDKEHFLAAGIGEEILDRLDAYRTPKTHPRDHGILQEDLKRVYDDLLEEAGVTFANFTQMIAAECADGRIAHCVFSAKSGLFAVRARVYIDCTGDGDLAVMAGAPYEKGDASGQMMAGTLCSLWSPVHWHQVSHVGNERMQEAYENGVFKRLDMHLPGMFRISDRIGGGNIGHAFGVDGTDERSMTEAMVASRRLLDEYTAYYRQYLTGFEDMDLLATGTMLGIRETRRILGDYVLNQADFERRAIFADEIGRFNYCVDIHASDESLESYHAQYLNAFRSLRYGPGESYGIPYRILLPQRVENLLVAGRCVSTDRAMQSSIRVMPGCYITGQAAGTAAALCARQGIDPRALPAATLQSTLKAIGAYLPNA